MGGDEFDTPVEEILAALETGEPVEFGTHPRFHIQHSTIPDYGVTTGSALSLAHADDD